MPLTTVSTSVGHGAPALAHQEFLGSPRAVVARASAPGGDHRRNNCRRSSAAPVDTRVVLAGHLEDVGEVELDPDARRHVSRSMNNGRLGVLKQHDPLPGALTGRQLLHGPRSSIRARRSASRTGEPPEGVLPHPQAPASSRESATICCASVMRSIEA